MSDEQLPKYLYSYDNERRRRKRRKIMLRRFMAVAIFCAFIVATVFTVRAIAFRNMPDAPGVTESTTTTEPVLEMTVAPVASTAPAAFGFATEVFRGSSQLPSYQRPQPISSNPVRSTRTSRV